MTGASETPLQQPPGPTSCSHEVPRSLAQHLRRPDICPPCSIKTKIKDIENIQDLLEARGGIFVSRPQRIKKDLENPEWKAHIDLRSRWRNAKIELYNDIMNYEETAQSPAREEGWQMLDDALRLWEREAEKLAEVPGYHKKLSPEELQKIVQRMMDGLQGTSLGTIGAPPAQDKDGDTAMADAAEEEAEAEAEAWDCPFPDSDSDSDSDTAFPDPGTVQHRIEQMENEESAMDVEKESIEPKSESNTTATADEGDEDLDFLDSKIEIESTSNSDRPETPTTNASGTKHVRFTKYAQISPEKLNFVPSLFPDNPAGFPLDPEHQFIPVIPYLSLSTEPTLRLHRGRTDATYKRPRSNFRHVSQHYKPGRWASPQGYMKADTSCYQMTWEQAEKHWKDLKRDAKVEKAAHKKLKAISGAYLMTHFLPVAWHRYQMTIQSTTSRLVS